MEKGRKEEEGERTCLYLRKGRGEGWDGEHHKRRIGPLHGYRCCCCYPTVSFIFIRANSDVAVRSVPLKIQRRVCWPCTAHTLRYLRIFGKSITAKVVAFVPLPKEEGSTNSRLSPRPAFQPKNIPRSIPSSYRCTVYGGKHVTSSSSPHSRGCGTNFCAESPLFPAPITPVFSSLMHAFMAGRCHQGRRGKGRERHAKISAYYRRPRREGPRWGMEYKKSCVGREGRSGSENRKNYKIYDRIGTRFAKKKARKFAG